MNTHRRALVGAAVATIGLAIAPAVASGHTEASAIAVPAGEEAAVAFAPEHGCGESPTIGIRIQAPVPDARAEAVEGWTATATPDGAGNTVLEWTGGLLPADQEGSFPVELLVPDAVGTLLAFPAIQRCENGEELAWIGTAPGDEYPAPQVLVLPPGSEPAATLDDVPADAPGRDLLVALLTNAAPDDDPSAPTSVVTPTTPAPATATTPTTAAPTTTPTTEPVATTAPPTTASPTTAAPTTAAPPRDDGGRRRRRWWERRPAGSSASWSPPSG